MTPLELIHAAGLGIDENQNPKEFAYLNELLLKWTMLQT
jgi:hypothetical protein